MAGSEALCDEECNGEALCRTGGKVADYVIPRVRGLSFFCAGLIY